MKIMIFSQNDSTSFSTQVAPPKGGWRHNFYSKMSEQAKQLKQMRDWQTNQGWIPVK